MVGGFAVIVTQDDGVSPEINLELLGRHSVGTGSAPQAVISSLVTDPLDRKGLKITDIDKFSPELQNPDITKPRRRRRCAHGQLQNDRRAGCQAGRNFPRRAGGVHTKARLHRLGAYPGTYPPGFPPSALPGRIS